ncbi:hypothetical protein [Actinoplanes sp. NPDC049802]|uniref:hypothetical protein n=1 Tax=Actinoplanes sp. NPDC049802 TaxID=3154742 RepID=UPI0033DDE81E
MIAVSPAHAATAGYPASAFTLTRDSLPNVVPGTSARIHFTLQGPAVSDPGPVELSLPLTGLPEGLRLVAMDAGSTACRIDHQETGRAWCSGLTFFNTGDTWIQMIVEAAPGVSRDLDWFGVPVSISVGQDVVMSRQDIATTRHAEATLTLKDLPTDEYDRETNGDPQTITGWLSGPETREQIVLELRTARSTIWRKIATVTTDEYQSFEYEYEHRINGDVRARFPGNDAFAAATSAATRLPGVQAGLIGWKATGTSKVGQTLTMTGRVVPSRRKVVLQWSDKTSGWNTVQTVESPADGAITLTWTPKAKGKYWVRAWLTGDHKAAWTYYTRVQKVS